MARPNNPDSGNTPSSSPAVAADNNPGSLDIDEKQQQQQQQQLDDPTHPNDPTSGSENNPDTTGSPPPTVYKQAYDEAKRCRPYRKHMELTFRHQTSQSSREGSPHGCPITRQEP